MNNADEAYAPPKTDLQGEFSSSGKGWKLLATWTVILVVINLFLSFVVAASQAKFESIDILISFVIGNAIVLPFIVLILSQIWKKYRNGRSRVKAILYPSYLVLFSQVASLFTLISEVADKTS